MKIVDRSTFLALPQGTVFSKYTTMAAGGLCIKEKTIGGDFLYRSLLNIDETEDDDLALFELWLKIEEGQEVPNAPDIMGRDGSFDDADQFLVFDDTDVSGIIEALQNRNQPPPATPS